MPDATRARIPDAAREQHFADISMGWPIILNGLKTHLEARAAADAGG